MRLASPAAQMLAATLLFTIMGVCVKQASTRYGAGEIVLYRSLLGLVAIAGIMRWQHIPLRSPVPAMHFWRSAVGTVALCMWFYSIGGLPLATAITLNYLSPVWIALFMIGGSVLLGGARAPDTRLVAAVLAGFAGVVMVLRPTLEQDQLWHGLIGLMSGVLAAVAYMQITALGRAGEPSTRVVLYFSLAGIVAGGALTALDGGPHTHTAQGAALLLAIGVLATLAQWLMTLAYAAGTTLSVASLQYLGIVFSVLFGIWLFDDPLNAMSLVGMVLIVAAGIGATGLRAQATPDRASPTDI